MRRHVGTQPGCFPLELGLHVRHALSELVREVEVLSAERLQLRDHPGFQLGHALLDFGGMFPEAHVHGANHGIENLWVYGRGRGRHGGWRVLHAFDAGFDAIQPTG